MVDCAPSTVTKTLKRFRENGSNYSRIKLGGSSKVAQKSKEGSSVQSYHGLVTMPNKFKALSLKVLR